MEPAQQQEQHVKPVWKRVARRHLPAVPFLLAAAAVGSLLSITSGQAQLFDAGDLSGEELYGRYCAVCHGPDGRGDGPVAATLRNAPPNLRRLAERNGGRFPQAAVRQTIDGRAMSGAHGTREMPIWGYEFWVEEGADVTAERDARQIIDRLVEFLGSIQDDEDRRFQVL